MESDFRNRLLSKLFLALPADGASDKLCYEVNPILWRAWCAVKGRDPDTVTEIWTEIDVAESAQLEINLNMNHRVWGKDR